MSEMRYAEISSMHSSMKINPQEYCKTFGHHWSSNKDKFCTCCGIDKSTYEQSNMKGNDYDNSIE